MPECIASTLMPYKNFYVTGLDKMAHKVDKARSKSANSTKKEATSDKRPKSSKKKRTKYIPEEEELFSSKEWLKRYGLKPLGLHLENLMSSHKHSSQFIRVTGHRVGAKYCDVFPKVKIRGEKMHMELHHHELVQYEENLDHVISRYLRRWRWLLLGPHRVFGTILEESIVICIDTSGSMITVINELKRELCALLWTVIKPNKIKFNIVQFASQITKFRDNTVEPDYDTCLAAAEFIGNMMAGGNTCTLEALTEALGDTSASATYLVTDGKPDTSCRAVLKHVASLEKQQKIHTISLNTSDEEAISFLKTLSKQTKGRYHACVAGFEGNIITHQLLSNNLPASLQSEEEKTLTIPPYSGDDLRLLSKAITKARKFMVNSQKYRDLIADHSGDTEMLDLQISGSEMIPTANPDEVSAFGV